MDELPLGVIGIMCDGCKGALAGTSGDRELAKSWNSCSADRATIARDPNTVPKLFDRTRDRMVVGRGGDDLKSSVVGWGVRKRTVIIWKDPLAHRMSALVGLRQIS